MDNGLGLGILLALALLPCVFAWLRRRRPMCIVTVIDGDTVVAVNEKGRKYLLRLRAIDCPELSQNLGLEAKRALSAMVLHRWVFVRLHGRDRYRRYIADIWTKEGRHVQSALISQGMAHALPGNWLMALRQLPARLTFKGVNRLGAKKPWEHRKKPFWVKLLRGQTYWQQRRRRAR